VLPGSQQDPQPHSSKTTDILGLLTATDQKICQGSNTTKIKSNISGGSMTFHQFWSQFFDEKLGKFTKLS
jgi:hypothetical protein